MSDRSLEETTTLISTPGVPLPVRDNRTRRERNFAVYLILASTIFERLAFYSLAINLVVTLSSEGLSWGATTSITASFIFFGTCYISTLIFAGLSDARLGRSTTIMIGFIIYFIGYVFVLLITNANTHNTLCKVTSSAHDSIFSEKCGPQIISTLIVIGIGIGSVQVNMTVFGAEQIQASKLTSRYFEKYYVAVNIGGTVATFCIPLMETYLNSDGNPNRYFYEYLIAMIMLVSSALLFLLGRRYYIHIPPYDTVIMRFIPVCINAISTWFKYHRNKKVKPRTHHSSIENDTGFDGNGISHEETCAINEKIDSFFDYANAIHGGKYNDRIVNDVKSLRNAIIVFIILIPYWIIYHQTQITFPLQSQQMFIPYLTKDIKLPISWMSLGDTIVIILVIIILNIFVYKYFDKRTRTLSIKTKFIIGMILASITMWITGTVEIVRQNHCFQNRNSSDLSMYTQLPQNIFMGLAEVFATIASLEFAYFAAPRSGQCLLMGLQFCSVGISSFIGKAYVSIYSRNIISFDFSCLSLNKWIFSTYFFMLGALQIVFIVALVLCQRNFQILKLNPQQIKTNQFQSGQSI